MFWVTDDILMHRNRHRVGLIRRLKIRYQKVQQTGKFEDTTISDEEELLNLVDTSAILRSSGAQNF